MMASDAVAADGCGLGTIDDVEFCVTERGEFPPWDPKAPT